MSQYTKGPVVIEYNGYEDFHITYGYGSGYLTALYNPRWVHLMKADDARKLCEKIRQLGMQFTH